MKRQRPKLTNDDSKCTTFRYNTRSLSPKGICITETIDEMASVRVTKQRKKISDEGSTKSDLHLPIDLIVEILKRLPVKTLARFLCVSKVWGSIIRSRDFMKMFMDESSNPPGRLFFTFNREKNCFVFSLNQISNPGEATYHLTHPEFENTMNCSSCVHDLICYETDSPSQLVVYNSTTKRSITLPNPELPGSSFLKLFLGYDPIGAVYKVLCMCVIRKRLVFKVLTLGNGNEWRTVKNIHIHFPAMTQICINGVLYYDAYDNGQVVVMSFDVRSEKFHLIKGPAAADLPRRSRLTIMARYEGNVAMISRDISANGSLVLWVLEDAVKHEWLKKVFVLSNSCIPSLHKFHYFLNITVAGEFVLAPLSTCVAPFYVLYYDPKRNSMRKVLIKGIREHELYRSNREGSWFLYHVFSSEVESLMFW